MAHASFETQLRIVCAVAAGAVLFWLLSGMTQAQAASLRAQEWPLNASHYNASRLWKVSQGEGVTVAVVDSGVDADHPDLRGQILPGASFIGDHNDDGRTDISPDSHGTAIAGIIAGTGHAQNNTGMIGLAPKAHILPVRVGTQDTVDPAALANGIIWATQHGAHIINVSEGTPEADPALHHAVDFASAHGAIVVAAAGNDGQHGDPPLYPAAFPGVLDVTGINTDNQFWPQSESGPQTTLAAPADNIYSTSNKGQYVNASGTSYAAPYVAATAALLWSAHPNMNASQIIKRLITTAQHQGNGAHSNQFGYGILDPLAALDSHATDTVTGNPLLAPHPVTRHATSWVTWALWSGCLALVAAIAITAVIMRRHRSPSRTHSNARPAQGHVPKARKSSSGSGTPSVAKTHIPATPVKGASNSTTPRKNSTGSSRRTGGA